MGDPASNDYVPFKVAYTSVPSNQVLPDKFEAFDPNITHCNQPVNVS